MRIFARLERDSANTTNPGEVEVSGDRAEIRIAMKDPDRIIVFPRGELESAVRATDI